VYLEIPSGEKIAQAFHSKVVFWNDACLLSSLEDGLNALLNIEVSFMKQLYHCHNSQDRLFVGVNFRTVSGILVSAYCHSHHLDNFPLYES
ncbi:hypothetical protein BHE74_00026765, partial [Ensete ventricosum]